VRSLDVICPGFSADCLETIEEIDEQNREIFLHAGGERYRYIPALNDRPDHVRFLTGLVIRNLQGWMGKDAEAAQRNPEESERLAETRKMAAVGADGGYGS
jgi:ferrochelatase